jgi:phosphotriesterase-related protein
MAFVRTVCGDISPAELGITHLHEHLLSDFTCYLPEDQTTWDTAPITLESLYRHRTTGLTEHNLTLGSVPEALVELGAFAAAGGRTVVDSTSAGIARDHEGLRELSVASGVNIVMGSGWYVHTSLPDNFGDRPVGDLAEEIVNDLTAGVADTGIRAGFIGEVGLSWPHHPWELKSLEAACIAQSQTGVMLQIHPGRHPDSPIEASRFCIDHGVDPSRVVISHIERTLTTLEEMRRVAELGCVLEFDLFGQESSYYFVPSFTAMPNDAGRIRFLLDLAANGFASQLAVSQDICKRTNTAAFGGEGLDHLLARAVPLMRRMGVDESFIEQLFVHTPARLLAWPS